MKQISVRIKIEGKNTSVDFDLPECWDEVPDSCFTHLAVLYLKTPEQMDKYDKALRAFAILAGIKAWRVLQRLETEELYGLLPHIDWVFDKLAIHRNRFPYIRYQSGPKPNRLLFGPADGLDNLRFGEWIVADGYFVDYSKHFNEGSLNLLIATIYRKLGSGAEYKRKNPSFRGDTRERFNDQTVDNRVALLEPISPAIKQSIFLWYACCRQQIITRYPDFFPANASGEQGDGWFGLYDDLMGDPKFGGAEKLEDTFIHTVFASVNRSVIKMAELKEKYDL